MMRALSSVVAAFVTTFAIAMHGGCSSDAASPAALAPAPDAGRDAPGQIRPDDEVRRIYPSLEQVYGGSQGIYRGCGPNNAVCHNGREFPNLATLGSITENIDVPCNQKRDKPTEIHNLCERAGDLLQIGDTKVEIAYVANEEPDAGESSRRWRIVLRYPAGAIDGKRLSVVRPASPDFELYAITDYAGTTAALDASDPKAIVLRLPTPTAGQDDGATIAGWMSRAGIPGDPSAIRVGDPNRDGVFGEALGGRLIKPGDPARSYIFKRLTDPEAGPLMPRANCCHWTKASLRALWCWVGGLASNGKNALEPIDYAKCPDGPADTVDYPEPGPQCEATGGMCPVQAKKGLTDEPTWKNLYENLLSPTCAGCHSGSSPQGGLDLGSEDAAYRNLVEARPPRVVPRDARASKLFVKVSPSLCSGDCVVMPKGGQPISDKARGVLEAWINAGAAR